MKRLLVALFVSLFFCMSCGDDDCPTCPGPPGASGSPPVISSLECIPSSAEVGEEGGGIRTNCSLFFRDPDGDLKTIVFSYLDGCGDDPGPLEINVEDQAGVRVEGPIQLENLQIKTNCVADTYTYEFVAEDSEESESNELFLYFVLVEPAPQ